jgi:hypothetical protein
LAQADAKAAPADDRRWRFSLLRQSGDPLRRWQDPAPRGGYKEIADMFPDFLKMCADAGRDPSSSAITVSLPSRETDLMKCYQDLGVERVVFNVESEPEAKVLPELDVIAALMAGVNG